VWIALAQQGGETIAKQRVIVDDEQFHLPTLPHIVIH
jgi:hypothetical protein